MKNFSLPDLRRCLVAVLGFAGFFLVSCDSGVDISKAGYDNLLAPNSVPLPVGSIHLEMRDIVKSIGKSDSYDIDTTGGTIQIMVEDEVELEFQQHSFDLEHVDVFQINIPYLPAGVASPTIENGFEININDSENGFVEQIDSIILNRFTLTLNLITDEDISSLEIGTRLGNGCAYYVDDNGKRLHEVEGRFLSQGTHGGRLQYDNIMLIPTQSQNGKQNIPVTITLKKHAGTALPAQSVSIAYGIETIDYRVAYGLFPSVVLNRDAVVYPFDISFLNGLDFYDPRLSVSLKTNIGSFFKLNIDSIATYHDDDPEERTYALFKNGGSVADSRTTSENIDTRALYPGTWSDVVDFNYDRDNGATNLLFKNNDGKTPNHMELGYSVSSYRMDDGNPEPFFIVPGAKALVKIKTVIPLHFSEGSRKVFSDTLHVAFSGLPELNGVNLEKAVLQLKIANKLPVKVGFLLKKFLDSAGNEIQVRLSETDKNIEIPSPALNTDGTVDHAVIADPFIKRLNLNTDSYEDIRKVASIVYDLKINQDAGKQIFFQSNDSFDVKFGVYLHAEGLTFKDLGLDIDSLINKSK